MLIETHTQKFTMIILFFFFILTGEKRGNINSIKNTKKIFWHAEIYAQSPTFSDPI